MILRKRLQRLEEVRVRLEVEQPPPCTGDSGGVAVFGRKEFDLNHTEGTLKVPVPLEDDRSQVFVRDVGEIVAEHDSN